MSEADMIIKNLKNSGKKVEEFCMNNKTSDKNVVTEEDLEVLNEVLLHNRETEQVRIAIEHILAEREQKDKRIQELEEERGHWHGCFIVAMENSIPKQVIEDNLNKHKLAYEELGIKYTNTHYDDNEIRARDFYMTVTEDRIVHVLQELLEGGK